MRTKKNWMLFSRREKTQNRPLQDSTNRSTYPRRMSMDTTQANPAPSAFKAKKSVALSGTPAGNTALCTVGHSGNDLHYRGYDIKDLAAHCEFEEVAHLLVHGKLLITQELSAYKASLRP